MLPALLLVLALLILPVPVVGAVVGVAGGVLARQGSMAVESKKEQRTSFLRSHSDGLCLKMYAKGVLLRGRYSEEQFQKVTSKQYFRNVTVHG